MDNRAISAAAPMAGVEYNFWKEQPPFVNLIAMQTAKANVSD
jgi:hypothetical protein